MPEHVHLLVSEPAGTSLANAMQLLKQNSSRQACKPRNLGQQELFAQPETRCAFWQKRYYDFNVRTAKKRIEKLKYMHRNPVKRGLCTVPEEWKWSSYRTYGFEERGMVLLNQWPQIRPAPSIIPPFTSFRMGHPRLFRKVGHPAIRSTRIPPGEHSTTHNPDCLTKKKGRTAKLSGLFAMRFQTKQNNESIALR